MPAIAPTRLPTAPYLAVKGGPPPDGRRPVATSSQVRLPPLSNIRAFEAALRLGSFERASEELSLTASAVGKRVATLESLLGEKLLVRRGRGVSGTVAGIEYARQVQAALGLLSSVALHQRGTIRPQRLHVSAPSAFVRGLLLPNLAAFQDAHPHVEIELSLSTSRGADEAKADLQVGFISRASHTGLDLLDEPLIVVGTPGYAREAGLRHPADLRHAKLIRCAFEPWQPWFAQAGLDWPEPCAGLQVADPALALEAAVCGMGVALARPSLAREWLDNGTLHPLFGIGIVPSTRYTLLPSARAEVLDAADAFSNWLRELCARVSRARSAAPDPLLVGKAFRAHTDCHP
ncbi:LysR substrate-binding domain-containing protein [Hydrogenophaga sp.]|jgi:LysR family glycine cleavage system transcriptional activator|uniref:LysR substrate-binding domain-containing protein n=1 Tax=Hydrogenophaga sp. TaxID=1904254 RepID=UPI003F704B50